MSLALVAEADAHRMQLLARAGQRHRAARRPSSGSIVRWSAAIKRAVAIQIRPIRRNDTEGGSHG